MPQPAVATKIRAVRVDAKDENRAWVKRAGAKRLGKQQQRTFGKRVYGQDTLPELARLLCRMFQCALCKRYRESNSPELFLRSGF